MASSSYQKFQQRLVLAGYLRSRFGMNNAENPDRVKDYYHSLRKVDEGYRDDTVSHLARHLLDETGVPIDTGDLLRYDQNVREHTLTINEHRDQPITWKYFQLLAALITEYYLDRLKDDPEAFAADINAFGDRFRDRVSGNFSIPEFTAADLDKVAYWMATGSGKTLLMHLNYYQALHYLTDRIDHIILLTPTAGLTRQHREAMKRSGIESVYYADLRGGFRTDRGDAVKVVEVYLLKDEATGDGKQVDVKAFEGNNLVFVDEGHKGASSDAGTWLRRRKEIVGDGFTFEYSATFGQVASGSGSTTDFEVEYGKSILFDYSYQRFYEDGYGKEFQILNLDPGADDLLNASREIEQRYLMANLLAFYEQQYVFDRNRRAFTEDFNLARPLLMFIGNSVTGKTTRSQITGTKAGRQSVTDVQRLIQFLSDVIQNDGNWATDVIENLLADDGSIEIGETSLFEDAFPALRSSGRTAEHVLSDLRSTLFHADGGRLHLVNIQNADGEIGLRAGDADSYFGVIDVGNDRDFMTLIDDGVDDIVVDLDGTEFEDSLFKQIDAHASPINVLVGSRKFIEGWSSWRVASMGLMNFGRGQGPQVIQLFGRGVRLLGWNRSLKRTAELPDGVAIQPPSGIEVVETLRVFGVRAKYMADFREYLKGEGVEVDEEITFDVQTQMRDDLDDVLSRGLKVVRPDPTQSFEAPVRLRPDAYVTPRIDLSPKVEAMMSTEELTESEREEKARADRQYLRDSLLIPNQNGTTGDQTTYHALDLIDWTDMYRRCWRHRSREGLHNLTLTPEDLRAIIENERYKLFCPNWMVSPNSPDGVAHLTSVVRRILEAYIVQFHAAEKRRWERTTYQLFDLEPGDNLLPDTLTARIRASNAEKYDDYEDLLQTVGNDATEETPRRGTNAFYTEASQDVPSRVAAPGHLYRPLMTQHHDAVNHSPTTLNEHEERFVNDLEAVRSNTDWLKANLGDHEITYVRNLPHSGIGFTTRSGNRFFPDFIIWIYNDSHEHIVYVDPKGLTHAGSIPDNHKVEFCRDGIREVEKQVATNMPVSLHAFIVSHTDFDTFRSRQSTDLDTREAYAEHNVYFQESDDLYVRRMLKRVVEHAGQGTSS